MVIFLVNNRTVCVSVTVLSNEMFTHSLNCLLVDLRFSALPFGNKNNRHLTNSKHQSPTSLADEKPRTLSNKPMHFSMLLRDQLSPSGRLGSSAGRRMFY